MSDISGSAGNESGERDVTIALGAYDALPYLVECLASLAAQTIGSDRSEVIAIDDGSTDGTGDYLETFAATSRLRTTVVRQANSGGWKRTQTRADAYDSQLMYALSAQKPFRRAMITRW